MKRYFWVAFFLFSFGILHIHMEETFGAWHSCAAHIGLGIGRCMKAGARIFFWELVDIMVKGQRKE